jgi:hypothetical protein
MTEVWIQPAALASPSERVTSCPPWLGPESVTTQGLGATDTIKVVLKT